jgi:hypothetical protein
VDRGPNTTMSVTESASAPKGARASLVLQRRHRSPRSETRMSGSPSYPPPASMWSSVTSPGAFQQLLNRLDGGEWVRPVSDLGGRVFRTVMHRAWYR